MASSGMLAASLLDQGNALIRTAYLCLADYPDMLHMDTPLLSIPLSLLKA